ncbi:uncharacterized protein LOC106719403 [Papilio machaon]|uniref:uncharacterized protein LOC106719403 n=1 Tax=Papilio machaon TaxID=76193 RepID=UPI001E6657C9|nr:uncharacterized protein LOC106719403 [Papilio machaon]
MNDVMEQIIESLAFEIEAVPNKNKGQKSTNVYNDPINVKIRIRNKDQNKILRQGVISIPNKDNPMYGNEKIQLSNSDQTIMSFNVLMEQDESTNKQRKHKRKFRFFKRGSCLGNQTEEDQFEFQRRCDMDNEQLVPIKSTSINDMNKRNFTLTKMYGNSDTRRMEKRTHKDILGECKPGGCLDPPYGEDKYSYVPKLIQMSRIDKDSNKRKSNEVAYKKPLNKNTNIKEKDEISYVSDKKDQLPISTNISLSKAKKSNSIITYPSISSCASLNISNTQKLIQDNNNDSRLSHTSRENVETYFISPKKIKINKFRERTNGTDFGIEKHSFVKPLSLDQDILKESKPEILKNYENTHPEGVVVDSKMTIQSNNKSFEKNKINSRTQLSSLADLSSLLDTKMSLNLTKSDLTTKNSLNNTIVSEHPDTDESSLKISLNPVTVSSASPKTIYKVESDTTILFTKNNVGQNKDPTKEKSSSKAFQQDQSFIPTKLDNGIELSEHEKVTNYNENGDELQPEFPIESEESMERDLNRYNTLKNYPTSETTDLDLPSALETGHSDFVNADITANSKSNEPVEIFTAVNNNLEQDNFTKKSKSGTNISLSINEHVKTPPPVELQHVIDNSEIQAQLSIDEPTKFHKNENIINLNEVLSTNEVNIQRSQETFVKLDKENESIPISNLDTSKDDQTSGFYETSTTLIDDEKNKKENTDFMHSLSKDTNLKETIHLNMAFQSFYSGKDGNVIRTIDTTKYDVQRYEDDNILKFMTLVKLGDSPISIPIDKEKKLLLQITKAKEKEDENQEITKIESISPKQNPKHKLVVFDEDKDDTSANKDSDKKKLRGSIKKCITKNTKSDGNLQLTLDNMYNQKLLPLHNTIKHLKNDVDGLLKQQLLIKDKLHNDKRIQLHKIPNNNKTCCCIEHILLKH